MSDTITLEDLVDELDQHYIEKEDDTLRTVWFQTKDGRELPIGKIIVGDEDDIVLVEK